MTYLDERDDTINYAVITVFSLATIAVAIYVFLGSLLFAYIALSLFGLAFLAVALFSIRKVFMILNYKEKLENYEANLSEDKKDQEFVQKSKQAKKQIRSSFTREMVKAILSGVFAIFTIIVLVLF